MTSTAPKVVVAGPASWNHLIHLDHLPEPVPHMQFAERALHTVGGTSAGKALHLADHPLDVELHALLADDGDGRRVAAALRGAGVGLVAHASASTERHVNLMTPAGERVSLYVSTPGLPGPDALAVTEQALALADIAVIDLSGFGATLLERRASAGGWPGPTWVDLHDYDGASAFHEPFLRAADVVFLNDDRVDDPWTLLASCLARGPRLAVCTRGADGAIALAASGERASIAALPVEVVDTNGAGDAFFAGFLAASLTGASMSGCLAAAAAQARTALRTDHLHPSVAAVVGDHT